MINQENKDPELYQWSQHRRENHPLIMISILVSLHDLTFSGQTPHHNLSFVMEPFLILLQRKVLFRNFVSKAICFWIKAKCRLMCFWKVDTSASLCWMQAPLNVQHFSENNLGMFLGEQFRRCWKASRVETESDTFIWIMLTRAHKLPNLWSQLLTWRKD